MPDLFVELFSEEIPARMQAAGAQALARLLGEALAPLEPRDGRSWWGPRRIATAFTVAAAVPGAETAERGPRENAPEQAIAGFLRKHGASRDALVPENGFLVLRRRSEPMEAATLVARVLPDLLRRLPWPKAMRWGQGSGFTWVRPLRRITCLLDGAVVPFTLATGEDDGHGLRSGDETEGHRFLCPAAFAVRNADDWLNRLRDARVLADPAERRAAVSDGLDAAAAAAELSVVPDAALLDEVCGLVEWPTVLLGRIDDEFMDLPPEVMQVSMRVNQRYFALRRPDGSPAPHFGFAANITATDGGAVIVAGNERVLRARFSDARHFWDGDRRTRLADRLPALERVTFQATLGNQRERAGRIEALARWVAKKIGADPDAAARAGLLCKADLSSGMVGEFPELQGVMGGYYARHDGEGEAVARAIGEHYAPRGPTDPVPTTPVSAAVAIADKADTLAGFVSIDGMPKGSGDPYALRRAALGILRIVREHGLRLDLSALFRTAIAAYAHRPATATAAALPGETDTAVAFLLERLRVLLRGEGARHDVLAAVAAAGRDHDVTRLLARTAAVAATLSTPDGVDLLAATRRAANILRIEERKDGPHDGAPDPARFTRDEERTLFDALATARAAAEAAMRDEAFGGAMRAVAALREPLDRFFERVTVNDPEPALRANRLRLLAALRDSTALVADLSLVET